VQVEQLFQVVHQTETLAVKPFTVWFLRAEVLLVEQHQPLLLLGAWAVLVVVEVLIQQPLALL
jgi:hypothetical protein